MTRQQAVDFLKNKPYKFGHLLGFTKLSTIHNDWMVDMLCGRQDATLQASRGTYKTTCVSIVLAENIILLPNYRTMFMRKTDSDVKEVIKQVQKILLDPHTQALVNAIYGVNIKMNVQSATEISTNLTTDIRGTSQLIGVGTGGSLTGKHFDRIFTDDIVNVQDRVSKAERERTKMIYQELQNIKNRGGRIYNTGTPWHVEDAFSIMPEAKRYDCYHKDIVPILPRKELEKLRKQMLPSLFAANYELRFVAAEDVIFTNPRLDGDPAMIEQGISHVDAAYGGEDYTALTIGKEVDGTLYIYGRLWRKHVDDVLDEIVKIHNGFLCGKCYCENNGDKGYLGKDMRKKGIRVSIYHETMNKFLKIVTHLKGAWEDIVFVSGTDRAYINQVCDFTEDADHDDAPDGLSSMVRILRKKQSGENFVPIW